MVGVSAFDALGKPSSNVSLELIASTGQTWTVPTAGGFASFTITLSTPEVVSVQAVYGSVKSQFYSLTVTAPVAYANPDWTGYEADPGSGVTAVGGSWIEPSVSGPNGSKVSMWVGIDGWISDTVEQCGVSATMVNGAPQYSAWYEFYGDQTPSNVSPDPNPIGADYYPVNLPPTFIVNAGDTISASVSLLPGTSNFFLFQMTDQIANSSKLESFATVQYMQYVTPERANAEWIVENPGHAGQPLADFDALRFTGAWATVNSATSDINSLTGLNALVIGAGTVHDTSVSEPARN